jgi:toxin ParE1/3/4
MRIVWSATAVENLVQIREYISQDKPGAAQKFVKKLISAVEFLAEHPHLGRPGREAGTRELIVSGTFYIVPYKISKNRLVVLAVLHGARDRS